MFDFRYHALSLVAVFLALGIGILLGVTIGDSLVSEADRGLRESLRGDVVEAREESSRASDDLEMRERLIEDTLPTVVGGRIAGRRVAVVGVGSLSEDMISSVQEAVDVGGGRVDSVSAFPVPPVTEDLTGAVGGRFAGAEDDPAAAGSLGRRIGRAIVDGGRLAERLAQELPDQFSGDLQGADAVVFHHAPIEGPAGATEAFETGLLEGIEQGGARTVGIEESDTEPSQIPFYSRRGFPSVDSVDVPGGRAGLVLALAGAEGSFGFKDTADDVLPQLPARGSRSGAGVRDRR